MEEDLKLLLSEYSRCVSSSPNFIDSPAIIPLLLRTGTFSPSRLERWPFALIDSLLSSDPSYSERFVSAFQELTASSAEGPFTLNEKKAVSVLLATREYPSIHSFLQEIIDSNHRILLASLEYSCFTKPLNIHIRRLTLPFAQINTLTPKFKAKYPLLTEMIANPTIEPCTTALSRLYSSPTDVESISVLECAARSIDPHQLHSQIIKPIWGTKNEQLAIAVLESLSLCPELAQFCQEYLKDLKH